MKTEILKIKGDWEEVVNDARETVGKPPLGHEPSAEFKSKILIAEHSPIRDLSVRFQWKGIKYWVAMHWKTHHWESKVTSQRSDRTGIPRDKLPQDQLLDFTGEMNAQAAIDTMRKRLCRQASPETRAYAEDFKFALHDKEPELSDVLCPNCVYRAGCPETHTCGLWQRLVDLTHGEIQTADIQRRYELYNDWFWRRGGEQNEA